MTSADLIGEINNLASDAVTKINTKRAMISQEIAGLEDMVTSVNSKINDQNETIKDLRRQLLDKSVEAQSVPEEDSSKVMRDKQLLQTALATARREQQSLVSQNTNLQARLKELESNFKGINDENLQKLQEIKSTLKMMTKNIENNADQLKTKIGDINDNMKTLLEGPVAVGGGEVIPLEISPPEDVEEPEVETEEEPEVETVEEPEVETDEEEPEVETDEEEPEVETDEEEPEVETDEEEPEVMVEGMDDKSDEEEPEFEFGKIRIEDSDDEF